MREDFFEKACDYYLIWFGMLFVMNMLFCLWIPEVLFKIIFGFLAGVSLAIAIQTRENKRNSKFNRVVLNLSKMIVDDYGKAVDENLELKKKLKKSKK